MASSIKLNSASHAYTGLGGYSAAKLGNNNQVGTAHNPNGSLEGYETPSTHKRRSRLPKSLTKRTINGSIASSNPRTLYKRAPPKAGESEITSQPASSQDIEIGTAAAARATLERSQSGTLKYNGMPVSIPPGGKLTKDDKGFLRSEPRVELKRTTSGRFETPDGKLVQVPESNGRMNAYRTLERTDSGRVKNKVVSNSLVKFGNQCWTTLCLGVLAGNQFHGSTIAAAGKTQNLARMGVGGLAGLTGAEALAPLGKIGGHIWNGAKRATGRGTQEPATEKKLGPKDAGVQKKVGQAGGSKGGKSGRGSRT